MVRDQGNGRGLSHAQPETHCGSDGFDAFVQSGCRVMVVSADLAPLAQQVAESAPAVEQILVIDGSWGERRRPTGRTFTRRSRDGNARKGRVGRVRRADGAGCASHRVQPGPRRASPIRIARVTCMPCVCCKRTQSPSPPPIACSSSCPCFTRMRGGYRSRCLRRVRSSFCQVGMRVVPISRGSS